MGGSPFLEVWISETGFVSISLRYLTGHGRTLGRNVLPTRQTLHMPMIALSKRSPSRGGESAATSCLIFSSANDDAMTNLRMESLRFPSAIIHVSAVTHGLRLLLDS